MKQLSLLLIFAFVCSTFAGPNDSQVTNSVKSNDSTEVKANQQAISNGDSAKYVKSNSIDSAQKAIEKHKKRKESFIVGITFAVLATVGVVVGVVLGVTAYFHTQLSGL